MPPSPDLVIADVDVGTQDISEGETVNRVFHPGETFEVIIDIDNDGDADAPSSTAAVFMSINGELVRMDSNSTSAITAGNSDNDERLNFTIPTDLAPGRYAIVVLADANGQVAESNENNNFQSFWINVEAGEPDLVISDVDVGSQDISEGEMVTATYRPGDIFEVSIDIDNVGDGPAPASTSAVFLSINGSFQRMDTNPTLALAAGDADNDERLAFTIPTDLAPGTYAVAVVADALGQVIESDDNNNLQTFWITIDPVLADLDIVSAGLDRASYNPGNTVNVSWAVENQGEGPIVSTQVSISLRDTATGTLLTNPANGTQIFATQSTTALDPGQTDTGESASFVLPTNLPAGNYEVVIAALATSDQDFDLANNFEYLSFTVAGGPADLDIINASLADSSLSPGDTVNVSWAVENQGGSPIVSTPIAISLRNTATGTLLTNPANGTQIFATQSTTALDPGQTDTSESASFVLPANLPAGNYQVVIAALADSALDGDLSNNFEYLSLSVQANNGYSISSPGRVNEDSGTITFTIARTGSLPAETLYASTVNGAARGYATNNGDYATNVNNLPVVFEQGQQTTTVTLSINPDQTPEPDETFGFILQDDPNTDPSVFLASVDWTIVNDDQVSSGAYAISGPGSFDEGVGTVTFTITRTDDTEGETLFFSTVQSEGWSNVRDYTGIVNRELRFGAGQSSLQVTVNINEDGAAEGSESFGVIVQRSDRDLPDQFLASTTFTILDNDAGLDQPTISLSSDIAVSETDEYAVLSITLSEPSDQEVSVRYSTVVGTASSSAGDYYGIVDQTVSFAPGETSATIRVRLRDDDRHEGTESFSIVLDNPQGLVVGDDQATITIIDDDPATQTMEGDGSVLFLATLAQAAYRLIPSPFEEAGDLNRAGSAAAVAAYQELRDHPDFQFLSVLDLTGIEQNFVNDPDFPFNGLLEGIFVNENAAALVGRMGNSIYVAFRGTNDNDGTFTSLLTAPDIDHWTDSDDGGPDEGMADHYDLLRPLIAQIIAYANSDSSIDHIYLTGHSLGAAMVQRAMYDRVGDERFSAITFASPGYEGLSDSSLQAVQLNIVNIFVDDDPILSSDFVRPLTGYGNGGRSVTVYHNEDFGSGNLHDMALYLEVARTIGESSLNDAIFGGGFGLNSQQVELDITYDGSWHVNNPADAVFGLPGAIFVSTPADDNFYSSFGDGLYSTANTTSPVLVDIAPLDGTQQLSFSTRQTHFSDAPPQDAGYAVGTAIGTDRLVGILSVMTGSGDDELFGNDLGNTFSAGAGDDSVFGRGGGDLFLTEANDGNDLYDGGSGSDTADYSTDASGFTANLVSGQLVGAATGSDQLLSIENVIGGSGNDWIAGGSGNNHLIGGAGNDILIGDFSEPTVVRASVSSAGVEGNEGSPNGINNSASPSLSADGRYVAFVSSASNLVDGDTNNANDAFVYDLLTGLIERVSVASDGAQANGFSGFGADDPSISGDGRFVAFSSSSSNLVAGDTNGFTSDIFLHDRQNGTTVLISVSSNGTQSNSYSYDPKISADGAFVVYRSGATNLVDDDTNGLDDIFVYEVATGITQRISVTDNGAQADGGSYGPAISADGHVVVFWSEATNLVADDTNGARDVFAYNLDTQSIERVSVTTDGSQADARSEAVSISGNGQFVAFSSSATNLISGETQSAQNLYLRDLINGTTQLVSIGVGGVSADSVSYRSAIDFDGRFISYISRATNLVPDDANGAADLFIFDRVLGTTRLVSTAADGAQGNGSWVNNAQGPSIDATGSVVAFYSDASNLVETDTNGVTDIFVVELAISATGADHLEGGDGSDTLIGGAGNDTLDGGSNVDTAILGGLRSAYSLTQTELGVFQVVGPDGTDILTNVEFLQFDDQTMRLLNGTGVSVNFETADPTVYQAAMDNIRDFDGNVLGGNGNWLRIGSADVDGDGDVDQILVNDAIGRFATVGGTADGLTYFDDHGWAGETRVVGIYIDPLVASGDVEPFSDNDSQRRFQNDLQIENINRVLGADDYDGDGLQEVYLALTDGTAYLHLYMHADGNIQYANYQSQQQVIDYLTANGYSSDTWAGWFASDAETPIDKGGEPVGSLPLAADLDLWSSQGWSREHSQISEVFA